MPGRLFQLGSSDIVVGRPFTNPEGSTFDLTILQYMVETVCRILMEPRTIADQPRPLVIYLDEVGGRSHRIVLSRPAALLKADDLTVVGFCGQRRRGVDREPIEALDRELIAEFPEHEYLLSYSTLQLESGDSCNLVLFSQPQGISHWTSSEKHALAISLSPRYYTVIRLHHAVLPGGLMLDHKLVLLRTKYYDFQEETVWHAVRDF